MVSFPSSPVMAAVSSPAASAGAAPRSSPTQLTPRSKIRALMAQVDNDDSENETIASPIQSRKPLAESTERANRGADSAAGQDKQRHEAESGNGKDSAEGIEIKDNAMEEQDNSSTEDTPENAYERVKARVLNGSIFKAPRSTVQDDEDSQAEEDEVVAPKGRMASRLQGAAKEVEDAPTPTLSPSTPVSKQTSSPYENVKEVGTFGTNEDHPFRDGRFLLRRKIKDTNVSSNEEDAGEEQTLSQPQTKSTAETNADNDVQGSSPTEGTNSRFLELVARKRKEREAREAEEERAREERLARLREELEAAEPSPPKKQKKSQRPQSNLPPGEVSGDDADVEADIDQMLTQQSRPTRKASKKALEEMSRETQRISRNMQLAHEARTRKKITKESLLAKFNFRVPVAAVPSATAEKPPETSATTSSSSPASDAEGGKEQYTPPTSPMGSPNAKKGSEPNHTELSESLLNIEQDFDKNNVLPITEAATTDLPNTHDFKEMAVSPSKDRQAPPQAHKKQAIQPRPVKVYAVTTQAHPHGNHDDSDSDLEVMSQKRSRVFKVLDRVQPATKQGTEGKAMLNLRALAHVQSPGKKTTKASTNPAALDAALRRRARQQAAREREEKIQDLRDRGVIVRTEEEKEREQEQMEDILERARRENDELARREKDARKKEAIANGEDILSSDEDEEYDGGEDEQMELDLSGSEDDGEGEADDEEDDAEGEDEEDTTPANDEGLVLDQAREAPEESEGGMFEDHVESDEETAPVPRKRRGRGLWVVDDEDEEEQGPTAAPMQQATPKTPAIVNPFLQMDSATKDAPLGLTQAFAATMADSQDSGSQAQDSLLAMDSVPPAPDFDMRLQDSPFQETHLADSNVLGIDLHFTQSQALDDSFARPSQPATQADIPDPTQDAGFNMSSPIAQRFGATPASTVDTVVVESAAIIQKTPTPRRKGRLQRRRHAIATFSDDEDAAVAQVNDSDADDDFDIKADAFNVMKKAAITKSQEPIFDKKTSKAQEMVEEQAHESEDEYAGLGGASDEESGGELDEETRKMIEEGEVEVDEATLAAFHANKERATDEKAVEKLFKDINNGGLRRKRRASLDLTDSEDDLEDRRRRKRAEFARMRKALLADENVGQIAEDPKKAAFMRCLEDRDEQGVVSDEDLEDEAGDKQDSSTQDVIPESQLSTSKPTSETPQSTKRKRPLFESSSLANKQPRLPATLRRTKAAVSAVSHRRPATLAEMRESISFLTEDPHSFSTVSEDNDDDDSAEHGHIQLNGSDTSRQRSQSSSANGADSLSSTDQNSALNPRRATAVVDRLHIKRAASLNAAVAAASAGGRMAFHDPATASVAPGFKVPSLLRRATAEVVLGGADKNGISYGSHKAAATERAAGGAEKGEFVRRAAGGKKSSVNFLNRDEERRVIVQGVERRRVAKVQKVAAGRKGVLGMLGSGRWE